MRVETQPVHAQNILDYVLQPVYSSKVFARLLLQTSIVQRGTCSFDLLLVIGEHGPVDMETEHMDQEHI